LYVQILNSSESVTRRLHHKLTTNITYIVHIVINKQQLERSSKDAKTKFFFPKIAGRLKLRINATPNFTAIVTGHGNIKTYLYKYKITESPMCSCEEGEQSVDHILYECKLLEQDRDRLKAAVIRSENWPVSKDKLSIRFYKNFKKFRNSILLDKLSV